ncbi:MAG: glyoxalase/bleomycin resistance/extradiol dioxygenase family protein [Polaromonas sp.]
MHSQIYVNLPVKDLPKSRAFFESMGYTFNPEWSNEQGACLVLGENLFAMLLTQEFFATFTSKSISDAKQTSEVINCLACESRDVVDALVSKAIAAGGTSPRAAIDHGFMYIHGYQDLDGHLWELMATATAAA